MKEAPILRTSPDVQARRHLLSPRPHSSPCFRLQSRCGQSGASTAVPKLLRGVPVQPPACTPYRPCPDNCQTALKRRLKAPSPRPPSAPSAQRGAVDHRARGGAGTLPRHPPKAVPVLGCLAQCRAGLQVSANQPCPATDHSGGHPGHTAPLGLGLRYLLQAPAPYAAASNAASVRRSLCLFGLNPRQMERRFPPHVVEANLHG